MEKMEKVVLYLVALVGVILINMPKLNVQSVTIYYSAKDIEEAIIMTLKAPIISPEGYPISGGNQVSDEMIQVSIRDFFTSLKKVTEGQPTKMINIKENRCSLPGFEE